MCESNSTTVLDNLEQHSLSPGDRQKYLNDLNARECLWAGLELLYTHTRRLENQLAPTEMEGVKSMCWGNIPGVPLRTLHQTACFFDWYSISASSFVELTRWILQSSGMTMPSKRDYLQQIIPEVIRHRNKVAAHASRVWPMEDGVATQEASNFRQLSLDNDRLFVNRMVLTKRSGNQLSSSRELLPWSLTQIHEAMRKRYALQTKDHEQNELASADESS